MLSAKKIDDVSMLISVRIVMALRSRLARSEPGNPRGEEKVLGPFACGDNNSGGAIRGSGTGGATARNDQRSLRNAEGAGPSRHSHRRRGVRADDRVRCGRFRGNRCVLRWRHNGIGDALGLGVTRGQETEGTRSGAVTPLRRTASLMAHR